MDKHGQQEYDFDGEEFKGDIGAALLNNLAASEPAVSKKRPAVLKQRVGRRKFLIGAGIAGGGLLVAGFAGYKAYGFLFPAPNLFKLTGPVTTNQDIVIFTQGQLSAKWLDWSWAKVDLHSRVQPYQNQAAIRVSLADWEALYLHDSAGPIDLTDFGYLQFYINGGSDSGQQVYAVLADAQGHYLPQTLIAPYVDGGRILSNTWKLARIPLAKMKASNTNISGVLVQDASGGTQPDVFIADLRLIYAPNLSAPHITQALALDLGTITLVFDQRMNQADVETTRFYSISGQESAYVTPQAPLSAHYHPT
ncbi:MAG TPA: hypothetical protein VH590_07330, partial [Ktedonobacterales bacterium]